MQYDAIILELMTRIKTLESDVESIKSLLVARDEVSPAYTEGRNESGMPHAVTRNRSTTYARITEEMEKSCYKAGKEAYQNPSGDMGALANGVARATGMNRSSAFIYIYVVKCMLNGEVYKRAISTKATEVYLNSIYTELGQAQLTKALCALQGHIAYRQELGSSVDGLVALYNQFNHR